MEIPRLPHEVVDRALLYSLVAVGLGQGAVRYFVKPFFEDLAANLSFTQEDLDKHISEVINAQD